MSFVCVNIVNQWGVPPTYQIQQTTTPSDVSTCNYIFGSGSDYANAIALAKASVSSGSATSNTPFDYTYAAGIWSLAFTVVVGLYLVARSAGTVLNFIRGRT